MATKQDSITLRLADIEVIANNAALSKKAQNELIWALLAFKCYGEKPKGEFQGVAQAVWDYLTNPRIGRNRAPKHPAQRLEAYERNV